MPHHSGVRWTVARRRRPLLCDGWGAALTIVVFAILGVAVVACGARPAPAAPIEGSNELSSVLASDARAEMILHHWQALTAIQIDDVGDAVHHVEHILEFVRGAHRVAMLEARQDLNDDRLHLAEHAIEEMLAGEAEPGLSLGLLHTQMALAALSREDTAESIHHVDHYVDVASAAAALHGRHARAALRVAELLDAGLHLSEAARIEAEQLETDRGCSGTGITHPGVRDGRIALTIVLDEEWVARYGAGAEAAARAVVDEAQTALGELGIAIDVIKVDRWPSPAGLSLHEMNHAAGSAGLLDDDSDLLLVLTDQDTEGSMDGAHTSSAGSHAIAVRHHRDHLERDAIVVAHEVGHLLDLTHEAGTFMQGRGFPETPYWSACQRDAVERLLAGGTL